jgi:hypothetical protein
VMDLKFSPANQVRRRKGAPKKSSWEGSLLRTYGFYPFSTSSTLRVFHSVKAVKAAARSARAARAGECLPHPFLSQSRIEVHGVQGEVANCPAANRCGSISALRHAASVFLDDSALCVQEIRRGNTTPIRGCERPQCPRVAPSAARLPSPCCAGIAQLWRKIVDTGDPASRRRCCAHGTHSNQAEN